MGRAELERCASDPSHLGECFRRVGFSAFDDHMLGQCGEFMRLAPSVDFQFDIMPDGGLGNTFGLSLSFNGTMTGAAKACMESGYGARLMRVLQDWGLADDRWNLIAGRLSHVMWATSAATEAKAALPCASSSTTPR